MIAAGHLGRARLVPDEEGAALVTVGIAKPRPVLPKARFETFAPARHEPIFYGASTDGELVAVMCYVGGSANVRTFSHYITDTKVAKVCAASKLQVIFLCTHSCVWSLDLGKLTFCEQLGWVQPSTAPIITFASHTVAVAIVQNDIKVLQLVPLACTDAAKETWGQNSAHTVLTPPAWAACATANEASQTITAFVGGTRIVAAQVHTVVADVFKRRSRVVLTSHQNPITSIAVTEFNIYALHEDGQCICIPATGGRRLLGTKKAISDTGGVV